MLSLNIETRPLFEVDAEQAGGVVGWVDARHIEDEYGKHLSVVAGYGHVAKAGAVYAEQYYAKGYGEGRLEDKVQGFLGATAIGLYRSAGGTMVHRVSVQSPHTRIPSERLFENFFPNSRPSAGRGKWVGPDENFLDVLRTELDNVDAGDLYENMYYTMAVITNDPLADKAQFDKTAYLVAQSKAYAEQLTLAQKTDETMRVNFTVFGKLSGDEIPDAFKNSREVVGGIERSLHDDLPSYMRDFYYPIGFRPSGRSWPYMDASSSDPATSYGLELRALMRQHTGPADHELKREIDELEQRIRRGHEITQKLGMLNRLERA